MSRRKRERSPLWPSVTVVGPDGAGKTALVEALTNTGPVSRHEHFRAFKRPGVQRAYVFPQDQTPYSSVLSWAKLFILLAEQITAEFPRRRARRRGIFVQERGWWDQLADPSRYRLPTPARRLVLLLGRILPRPSYLVLVTAPAELIHARKQELSVPEISRQTRFWLGQERRATRGILVVDTSKDAPDLLAQQVWARLTGAGQ